MKKIRFITEQIIRFIKQVDAVTLQIGYVESFNGKPRDECLNKCRFASLATWR